MACVWKVWAFSVLSLAGTGFLTAGLAERNPFVWPGFEPPEDRAPPPRAEPAPQRGEDMEFRAIYELNGVMRALIRNRADQSHQWVTLGEEGEGGVLAKLYNREQNQLLLSSSAGERWLNLQGASGSTQRPLRPDVNRTRGEEIEFHAVYEMDGVTRALVRNRIDQTFHWVTVGADGREGFSVSAHNREHNRILLSTADGERWLDLQRSAVASAPAVQAPPSPGVHRPTPPRATPTPAATAGPRPPAARSPAATPARVSTTASRSPAVQTASDGSVRRPVATPRTRVPPTLRSRGPSGPNPGLAPPNYTPPSQGMEPPTDEPPSIQPVFRGR